MQQLRGCFNKLVTYCEVIVQNLAREMPFDMKLVAGWGGGLALFTRESDVFRAGSKYEYIL